nr:uncharacterized protein LOC123570550 isoform X2 [Macaca fascicularis]
MAESNFEKFAFTIPAMNNKEPADRYHWKVLPQERISFLSGYPQGTLSCAMSQNPRKSKRPRNVPAPPVHQMAQRNISVEQMETSKTRQATPSTWGQKKRLAHIAEGNLRSQNKPLTTSNLMSTDADGALGEKPDTMNEP